MMKPGKSRKWIIAGLILQGIGSALYLGGLANSLKASIFSDTSGSNSGMAIGGLLALLGWISLLVGISRASAGIDYLVSLAPEPVARLEQAQVASAQAAKDGLEPS
ncbi:hypothetical protein ABH924_000140 [Arthrobacter sp. GAS37]|uniref:hypothetical protein n=1 Tax=Arthrobacter sp. GAS37 TaxID=3156261 RepID=UPI003837619E